MGGVTEADVGFPTVNCSEHDGRSFKRCMDVMLSQVAENISFFFIEIENFRGEGTHDTTFSEKILDFYKILEESEQFFI